MEPLLKKNQSDGQTFSLSLMQLHIPSLEPTLNPEAIEHDRHPHNLFISGPFSHT